jgi:hypothetical protein
MSRMLSKYLGLFYPKHILLLSWTVLSGEWALPIMILGNGIAPLKRSIKVYMNY